MALRIGTDTGFVQGTYLQMDLRSGTGVHLGEHWWSSFSPSGVAGQASLAYAAKGEQLITRAATNLGALAREIRDRPDPATTRQDLH